MSIGVYDEGQTFFGDLDQVFAQYKALHVGVLRVNLYWGGTLGVAKHRPFHGERSARRRLRLVALRPHGVLRGRVRDQAALLDHRHAAVGERRRRARTARRRTTRYLRGFAYAAAARYSGTYVGNDGRDAARRAALGGLERAEQPDLPPAAVRQGEGRSG